MNEQYEETIVQSNITGSHTRRRTLHEHIEQCQCEANHRKIRVNDVIWDIDVPNKENNKKIAYAISTNLLVGNIAHSIWDTSRSYHIHSQFNLSIYPLDVRKALRMAIMRHYALEYWHFIDKSKASENVMIRMENGIHENTGQRNTLKFIEGDENTINPIPEEILRGVSLRLSMDLMPKIEPVAVTGAILEEYAAFVNYCQKSRFDQDGGRSMKLFKNIAIACFRIGLDEVKVKALSEQVGRNCKGKKQDEVLNWWRWCKKQKHNLRVNWGEVEVWYGKS